MSDTSTPDAVTGLTGGVRRKGILIYVGGGTCKEKSRKVQ